MVRPIPIASIRRNLAFCSHHAVHRQLNQFNGPNFAADMLGGHHLGLLPATDEPWAEIGITEMTWWNISTDQFQFLFASAA